MFRDGGERGWRTVASVDDTIYELVYRVIRERIDKFTERLYLLGGGGKSLDMGVRRSPSPGMV